MEIEKVKYNWNRKTTENYLQNHIHNQLLVPGNLSHSNATRHQKRKAVVIGDSHLNRINKSSFKNDNLGHPIYFKCFSGSNTKQLNYYANPTLVDEEPNTVIVHVSLNNINKFHKVQQSRRWGSCTKNNRHWEKMQVIWCQ